MTCGIYEVYGNHQQHFREYSLYELSHVLGVLEVEVARVFLSFVRVGIASFDLEFVEAVFVGVSVAEESECIFVALLFQDHHGVPTFGSYSAERFVDVRCDLMRCPAFWELSVMPFWRCVGCDFFGYGVYLAVLLLERDQVVDEHEPLFGRVACAVEYGKPFFQTSLVGIWISAGGGSATQCFDVELVLELWEALRAEKLRCLHESSEFA